MDYIFVDSKDNVEIIGLVEDYNLVELYIDDKEKEKQVGNIYRGRVENVLPGMEAAFIDIGEGKNAYLYIKQALPKGMEKDKKVNIGELIKKGDEIIVQVLKEPSKNKGAKVTTHITLPGRYVILTPYSNKISLSRKIVNTDEIERLKGIGKSIIKHGYGMIFRTKAAGIKRELLEEEYNLLIDMFKKIERERNFLPCPKLIYKEIDLSHQIIRDVYSEKVNKIILNDREKYESILSFQGVMFPKLDEKIHYDKDFNIFYHREIMEGIKTALNRKVFLKSGGYIVIDETEALTAIDVNTGKFIGDNSLEDTVVKTNLEACEEIARQIRLRDITGIIIIDFIDMKDNKDVSMVLERLEERLNSDRNKANIIGITKLGLVELTRKKTRNSLTSSFIKECSNCNGSGRILYRGIDN